MVTKVAINGFGRIGRLVLRAIVEIGPQGHRGRLDQRSGTGRNQRASAAFRQRARAFPARGPRRGRSMIQSTATRSRCTAIKDPAELPHKELGVDIALECTGIFTARDKAAAHLTAGAKRVLVSAPSDGADLTVVYGVNHDKLTKEHLVLSNASCTTNCLAPVAKVLNDAIGIEHGFMTTIHSYTGDQPTLDTLHKDLYRARARGAVDDPDHDRRGQGRRPRAAGAQGQARRFGDPRPDAERLGRRPEVRRQARDHQGRDQRGDDQGGATVRSRAFSATPTSPTSRSTSTTTPVRRSSTSTRPR